MEVINEVGIKFLLDPIMIFMSTLGASGFIGFCLGIFIKKIAIWGSILIGFVILIIGFLGYRELVIVNWSNLTNEIYNQGYSITQEIKKIVIYIGSEVEGQNITILGGSMFGFTIGFMYGLKRG